MTSPAEWFGRQLDCRNGRSSAELNAGHAACLAVLATLPAPSGLYNLPTPVGITDAVTLHPSGALSVLLHGELATFDADGLTRLVLAAHKHQVRVSVSAWVSHLDRRRARIVARDVSEMAELDPPLAWDDPAVNDGLLLVRCTPRSEAEADRLMRPHPTYADLAMRLIEPTRAGV